MPDGRAESEIRLAPSLTLRNEDNMSRIADITRRTKETDIFLSLELDGSGEANIETDIGFFDHMLSSFARHGFFNLECRAKGDLEVDVHHTIEDVGICLGEAIKEALAEKRGIRRFGDCILPMDDALILVALDLSGRPYFDFDCDFLTEKVGEFDTEMTKEFFYAVSYSAGMNLHIRKLAGSNSHHIIEAMCKAFGRALDQASGLDERVMGVPSTKGSL